MIDSMKILLKFIFCICILFSHYSFRFSQAATSSSESVESVSSDWMTLESPHFRIHFREGGKVLATHFGHYLEEAYSLLTDHLDWRVENRIEVVLQRNNDVANGFASVFPFNKMVIHAVPFPPLTPIGEYGDWLRTLAIHELTHVIANDTSTGVFSLARSIFGSISKVNSFQPGWLIEGLAVYEETRLSDFGRGRSPYTDMVIRTWVLNDLLDSDAFETGLTLDRLHEGPPVWTRGMTRYLAGYLMNETIAKNSDFAGPARFSKVNSGRIPGFLNGGVSQVTQGKDFNVLWKELVAKLKEEALGDLNRIRQTPLSSIEELTSAGRRSGGVVASRDGRRAYLFQDSYESGWGIIEVDLNSGKKKKRLALRELGAPARLRLVNDEEFLLYSRLNSSPSSRGAQVRGVYRDLYLYDLTSKDCGEIRLTEGMRARYPEPSPDFRISIDDDDRPVVKSGQIVFVKMRDDGNQDLVLWNGQSESVLYAGENYERLSFPAWGKGSEKQGEWIVFQRKISQRGDRLFAVHLPTKNLIQLTRYPEKNSKEEQKINEATPSFSEAGDLLFSSSADGVWNIYQFSREQWSSTLRDRKTRVPQKISHLETGAFSPVSQPDSKKALAMVYTARGFQLAKLGLLKAKPMQPALRTPKEKFGISQQQTSLSHFSPQKQSSSVFQEKPYSAFPGLWPKYWFPTGQSVVDGWTFGVNTSGEDAIGRHRYSLFGGWDTRANFPLYRFSYGYSGWGLPVSFQASQYNEYIGFSQTSYKERNHSATVLLPLGKWQFSLGFALDTSRFLVSEEKLNAGVTARIAVGDRTQFPNSIDPVGGEKGYSVSVGGVQYLVGDEKFFNLDSRFDLRVPSLFSRHFIRWAGDFAYSSSDFLTPNALFTGGGESLISYGRRLMLRGYVPGFLIGRKIATSNLEYWMPLLDTHRGEGLFPVFLKRTKLRLFADVGSAEFVGITGRDFHSFPVGVGFHLLQDIQLFYRIPITLAMGYHRGLKDVPGAEEQVSFGFYGAFF